MNNLNQAGRMGTILAAALFFMIACSEGGSTQSSGERPRPSAPVTVATVVQRDVPIEINSIGNVEAYATVPLKSRVSGPIIAVHFQEGQEVKEGDLMFTIDPLPYQVALKQAQAQLDRDRALLRKAQADLRRNAALVDKNMVSHQEYDQLKATADSLEATVKADQALVENAGLQLEYCAIKAPFSGRTGTLEAPRGTLVKASDDNKSLVTITQIQPIFVSFTVPEQYYGPINQALAAGQLSAAVRTSGSPGESTAVTGKVTFLDNTVDVSTGTIRLKATFTNKDRGLWPGQFVTVVLRLGVQSGALVIPNQAIQTGQAGTYVFVVGVDSKVELRPVTVSRTVGDSSIIAQGLKPGEKVVTGGQLNLVPGAQATIRDQDETVKGGAVK